MCSLQGAVCDTEATQALCSDGGGSCDFVPDDAMQAYAGGGGSETADMFAWKIRAHITAATGAQIAAFSRKDGYHGSLSVGSANTGGAGPFTAAKINACSTGDYACPSECAAHQGTCADVLLTDYLTTWYLGDACSNADLVSSYGRPRLLGMTSLF